MEGILLLSAISITTSGISLYFYLKHRLLVKKLNENPSFETQMILADLMRSGSLLRLERVAPEHFFLRRP